MKRHASIALLGTLLAGSAYAGLKSTGPIVINYPTAQGNVGDARSSGNLSEQIGCTIHGYTGATSLYAFCSAADAAGHSLSCSSTNPYVVQAAAAITSFSYVTFQVDSRGNCTYMDVQNHSNYTPMVP